MKINKIYYDSERLSMIVYLTKEKFSNQVISLVKEKQYEVIDALMEVAENYEVEPEEIKNYMSSYLETILFRECQQKNLLTKMNTLF